MNFDFGKNLKRICKQRGTSPTKVVTGLGFTNSKVNMWNNGSLPKAEMLVLLAQPYGANPNHLFFFVKHTFGFVKEIEATV